MRFLFIIVLAIVMFMTACNTGETTAIDHELAESSIDETTTNNDTASTPTDFSLPEQSPTLQEAVSDNPYPVFENNTGEEGLTPMDFESAYQLCQDAISDFFSNQVDDEFDKYVENSKLLEYISQSAEWSKPEREIRKIGLSKSEFYNDNLTGRKWFFFNIFIELYNGGEVIEIIVKESAEGQSLVIADWYILSPLYMDDITRSHGESIHDPDIWEDSDFADEMLRKAQEIINY